MPRYFLNQVHKSDFIPDLEGEDFADLDDVRKEAVLSARQIMIQRLMKGEEPNHSRFEIVNEDGKLILTVPFSEAIPREF